MTDFFKSIKDMRAEGNKSLNWIVAFGAISVVVGVAAIVFAGFASLVVTMILGAAYIIAGLTSIVVAFKFRHLGGFWSLLIFGVLFTVGGLFILRAPVANMEVITLVVGIMIGVTGISKMIGCFFDEFEHKGMLFLNGLISFLCAAIIVLNWPFSGFWVLGTFVGVDLIFGGITTITYASAAKKIFPKTQFKSAHV